MEAKVMEGIMKFEIGSPKPDICHLGIDHSHCLHRILDNETTWDPSSAQLETQALTIQRAWRNYKGKCVNELNANRSVVTCEETTENLENRKETCLSGTSSEPDVSEAESGHQAMSVSSQEESLPNLQEADDFPVAVESRNLEGDKINAAESAASDVDDPEESDSEPSSSNNSPVVKESRPLLTSKIDLCNEAVYGSTHCDLNGANEEIAKQVRKHNYLTMAQEFASFKKLNPDALPYNLHRTHRQQIVSDDDETSARGFTEAGRSNLSGEGASDDCRYTLRPNSDDERSEVPQDSSFSAENDKLLSDFEYMPKTDVPDILKVDSTFAKNGVWSEKNALFWNVKESKVLHNYDLIENFHPKDCFDNVGFDNAGNFITHKQEQPLNLKDYCAIIHEHKRPPSDDIMHINDPILIPKNDNRLSYVSSDELCKVKSDVDAPKAVVTKTNSKSNRSVSSTIKYQVATSGKETGLKSSNGTVKSEERGSSKCRAKEEKTLANSRSQSSYHRSKVARSHDASGRRKESKKSPEYFGEFDVYNIETAMPTIDWVAMEEHLAKAAKEEEQLRRQRRNDREEIRRRLAMGSDTEDYYGGERMTRKPSLQTRLQSGMNLQICFLNETAGEHENISTENDESSVTTKNSTNRVKQESSTASKASSLPMFSLLGADNGGGSSTQSLEEMDFVTRQAKLQAEARLALAQAKEMAHMQMEIEKQRKKKSPITEMVGINFPDGRKIASRQVMNEMNFAQLQVIVNDLHTQIESLNEELVRLLLERDDLHMEQDSMLVDIEDLTRYLGAKDRAKKENQAETDTLSSKLSIASQKLTPKLMAKLKK